MPWTPTFVFMVDGAPAPPADSPSPPLSVRTSQVGGKPGLTVVIVMALALILVLSIVLLGASSGGPTAVSFSSARAIAGTTAATVPGTWNLVDAVGYDASTSTSEPLNLSEISSNCTVTPISGRLPSSLTFPSFHGNLSAGVATEWELDFLQPATQTELAISIADGSVNLAVEISGPGCFSTEESGLSGIPSTVVDSTVAASTAASAGAGTFLAAHPNGVTLEMILFPYSFGSSGISESPEWLFDYSTCPLNFGNVTSPPGETFSADVNASTGQLVIGSVLNGSCGNLTPALETIGAAMQLGLSGHLVNLGIREALASEGSTIAGHCSSLCLRSSVRDEAHTRGSN